ncbi:MAG TPA: heme-binding protein [Gemmataceae bacterium]|nr:heme-binding protein [Gemmataceae bacterium]
MFRSRIVLLALLLGPAFVCAQEKKPLVTRVRVQLNLAGAEMIVEAVKAKAAAMGLKVNVAVVDDGGHLLAFARMDGARPASGNTALTKAAAAATFRQETGPRPPTGEPDLLLSLSLPAAAIAGGGKGTALKGGVPIVVDGQVIGAVGIGGGTGEQDVEVAKAGIEALLKGLAAK